MRNALSLLIRQKVNPLQRKIVSILISSFAGKLFTLSSGGVPAAAPPFMLRMVDVVRLDALATGNPGWITAKAELVPAKRATRNKGFKAVMLIVSVLMGGRTSVGCLKNADVINDCQQLFML